MLLLACLGLIAGLFYKPVQQDSPPPDFSALDGAERKDAFFAYLRPLLQEVNADAQRDRDLVEALARSPARGDGLSWHAQLRLSAVAGRYGIEFDDVESTLESLLARTGTVPVSLALVQAAKESGWGTSRFAREGNNLFGQRCNYSGCGIRPKQQAEGATWGVARFDSIRSSLESYLRNLNTHKAYREFRAMRLEMRMRDEAPNGFELAGTLQRYSEQGERYVADVRSMIRQNGLE